MRDIFVSWGYTLDGQNKIDVAKNILKRDLSSTRLIPLSDPPAGPATIRRADIAFAAQRRSSGVGARRHANHHWRADSLKFNISVNGMTVVDISFGLEWLFPYAGGSDDSDMLDVFRMNVGKQLAVGHDQSWFRPPSYDEFITGIEALDTLDKLNLVPLGELYLIGDKPGPKRTLLVEIFRDRPKNGHLKLFDGPRLIIGTDLKINAYELSFFEDPAQYTRTRALQILVKPINA